MFKPEPYRNGSDFGTLIRMGVEKKPALITLHPKRLSFFVDCGYDIDIKQIEREKYVLYKVIRVWRAKNDSFEIRGSSLIVKRRLVYYEPPFREEKEKVEEKAYHLIAHPEVNEGGFGFFAALLSEIKRLEKEISEIRDELDRKRGDYLLSDLPILTSIGSLLPSLPAIICGCGAVHFPSPRLGWWHQSCPSCGNKWKVEGQWVFRGGWGSPPLITSIAPHPYEDNEGDSSSIYIITISAEKPIIYVCSFNPNLVPKENVILINVNTVQHYNNLLQELEAKKRELEKKRQELESGWEEYKAAVDDLINYGGILICEGKCAVILKDGEVVCFSNNQNINTIELAADIKTAVKYFGGEA
jgi:DNA repair exonuclease SbcCD ATPase subunit